METFIAAIIVMMSLATATFQIIRNKKYRELTERKQRLAPIVLYVNSLLVLCDLAVGGYGFGTRLLWDMMLASMALSVLSSSLWNFAEARKIVYSVIGIQSILSIYYILCLTSLSRMPDDECFKYVAMVTVVAFAFMFLISVWFRLREVRAVMNAGTVWASLALAVDAFYTVTIVAEAAIGLAFAPENSFMLLIVAVLICGAVVSCGVRIACDSVFILLHRQERRIVESLKISPVEVAGMGQREDDIYKDIYERVLEYFERDKPYLSGALTINDVVSVVFTNKLYISRAISQYTGRNFCQFVNYHRVMYSVACFRANTDLKVTDLWQMSGFNSIVSYNMAFRLFMGENPSDWCRKEKISMSRRGK